MVLRAQQRRPLSPPPPRAFSPLIHPTLRGVLQPWGLKISVYLPRQSLRYLLDLTVRQVAAVIEDARLEQWEKDMLDHDKVFKVSVCVPPLAGVVCSLLQSSHLGSLLSPLLLVYPSLTVPLRFS